MRSARAALVWTQLNNQSITHAICTKTSISIIGEKCNDALSRFHTIFHKYFTKLAATKFIIELIQFH